MKGQLMLATVALLIASIIIIAIFSPLTKDIDEVVRTSAATYASEIAAFINILQSSPPGTEYTYTNLPSKECRISIASQVTVVLDPEGNKKSASTGIILNDAVKVRPAEFECGKISRIVFTRGENEILAEGA